MLNFALFGLFFGLQSATDSSVATSPHPKPKPVVIKAGRLFDGTGDALRTDQIIVIEGDRITAVGPPGKVQEPDGAT